MGTLGSPHFSIEFKGTALIDTKAFRKMASEQPIIIQRRMKHKITRRFFFYLCFNWRILKSLLI